MSSGDTGSTPARPPPLGVLVRAWRERALLTQEQLAMRTGLAVRTIRRLESEGLRRPRIESIRLLADALGLTGPEQAQLIAAARSEPAPHAAEPSHVPRQLIAALPWFIGRVEPIKELDRLIADDSPAVVVIAGTAGVGKTALAMHWAHRVSDRFPDGQLYVNLRGFDPPGAALSSEEAVRRFLDALGVPPQRIPMAVDAQAALYRSLLAGRRMLVVLDNARDHAQVHPLLPGTRSCLVIVTSRNQLGGLVATDGAHPIGLTLLSEAEAHELLNRRLGADRVAGEPEAVDTIILHCARLPLALAIVAARATTFPDTALGTFAEELSGGTDALSILSTGAPSSDVRAVISWSYRTLRPGAARLFRLLGVHPGPDVSAPAAASLAGIPLAEVRLLLAELSQINLIEEHVPSRFGFHDLLRAYAIAEASTTEPDDEIRAAVHRMLDHYLHTAYAATLTLHPLRRRFELEPSVAGVVPEQPHSEDQAVHWFAAERTTLVSAVCHAAETGFDRHTYQLAWCLTDYLDWRGYWSEWAVTQHAALRAAERLGDRAGQVLAHRGLAGASFRRGDYGAAHEHLLRALAVLDQSGAAKDEAQVHLNLSAVLGRQGRHGVALQHAQRALELYRSIMDQVGEAYALEAVGSGHSKLGDRDIAVDYCRESLALHRQAGNREGEAATLDSLGNVYRELGRHADAAGCHEQAIGLCRALGNRYYEAFNLTHLGDTHEAAGDPGSARDAWRRAFSILDDLDHPEAEQLKAKLAGSGQRRPSLP